MHSKKGQKEGGAIAVILILIAFFMVLYILFIPPEDRNRLLDNTGTSSGISNSKDLVELLAESPGLLSPNSEAGTRHSMQEINLFVKTEPRLEEISQNMVVKNGLFSKSSPNAKFSSEKSSDTTHVSLNFFVSKADGELRIKLNGQTIYSEEIESTGAKVVDIPSARLQNENELEFSVSSPGIAFWSSNTYNLKDVVLKQEFSRVNSKEERSFSLSNSEFSNIESATLSYTQVCNGRLNSDTTNLLLRINDRRASDSLIRCTNTEQDIDLDTSLFVNARNTLSMELEDGDFSFKQLSVFIKSSDSSFPSYQFTVPTSEFNEIKDSERKVKMSLFLAGNLRKNAKLEINNNEIVLDTSETSFSRDVSSLIVEGTNFVRIIPSNSFTMTGLKFNLE